jgi:3-oxoisoapionate decarboxylase
MRLGISSYTYVWGVGVPGFPQPQRPLTAIDLLDRAVELGVTVVQIADNLPLHEMSPVQLMELAAAAQCRGITLEVGTSGIQPAHLLRYRDIAVHLQSALLRVVLDTDKSHPTADEAAAALDAVLPRFAESNVTIAIENHDRFPAATLATMMDRFESPHLGICLDTANSLGCGEDLATVLRVLGPWVVNLHVKDFCAHRLPHKKGFLIEGCPAGTGLLHIPRLLDDLRGLSRDPNVILEFWPPPENSVEASAVKEDVWARESVAYLRQLISN